MAELTPMMQQYFDDVDHIADAIIYNRDIIRLMRNKKEYQKFEWLKLKQLLSK